MGLVHEMKDDDVAEVLKAHGIALEIQNATARTTPWRLMEAPES